MPVKNLSLWIFLGIAVLLGLFWQFVPLANAQNRVNSLPLVGAKFGGKDIPETDFEKKFFYNIFVLKRLYNIQNEILLITVLDGTNNRNIVHDPYYCFRGSGWDIINEKTIPIPNGNASLVNIRKGALRKEAIFWFGNGVINYSSPLKYFFETTLRRLTFGLFGHEPVLILIQPVNHETINWEALPDQFPSLFKL